VYVIRKSAEGSTENLRLLYFIHNIVGLSESTKPKNAVQCICIHVLPFYYIHPSHLCVFECIVAKLSRRISRKFHYPFSVYRNPWQCLERQDTSPVYVFISHTVMVATVSAETLNSPVCCCLHICTLKIYLDNFQFQTRMLCTLRMEWFYCISV
jgi:hypothetical protein